MAATTDRGTTVVARRGAPTRCWSSVAVCARALRCATAADRAGPRGEVGDGERSAWSEPDPVEAGLLARTDWAAGADHRRAAGEAGRPQRSALRREFASDGVVSGPGCTSPRSACTRREINGAGRRRPRAGARLDQLRPPPALPDLRRDRACCAKAATPSARMLGDGWYRGRLGFGGGRRNLYGDRLALLAQLEITYADGTTERVVTDDKLARRPRPDPRQRASTTARPTTPAWSAPAGRRPASTTAAGRAVAPRRPRSRARSSPRPGRRCAAPRCSRRSRSSTSPSGAHDRRLRPEPGRPAADHASRAPAGHDDHAAPRRGARGRRAVHPPAARRAAPPTATPCAAAASETWEPRFTFHGFRYAEVDRLAGRAASRTTSRAVVCHSDLRAHRLVRVLGPAGRTGCTRTSCGACAATSSTCPPTARSATSASAGPATSRSSRPPPPSSTTAPGLLALLAAPTSPPSSSADGVVPFVVPERHCDGPAIAPAAALGRRGGDRAVGAVPALRGRRACWPRSTRACAPGSTASPSSPARAACGTTGFQFGDWLDPAAPPDEPGRGRAPTRYLVATAYFARSARAGRRRPPACSAEPRTQRATPALADAGARRLRRRVRHARRAPAQRRADRLRAGAASSTCCPTPTQRAARRPSGWPSWCGADGYRISTGFVGTPLICDALCRRRRARRRLPPADCSASARRGSTR